MKSEIFHALNVAMGPDWFDVNVAVPVNDSWVLAYTDSFFEFDKLAYLNGKWFYPECRDEEETYIKPFEGKIYYWKAFPDVSEIIDRWNEDKE